MHVHALRTYGAMYALFPEWIMPMLKLYLTHVRPRIIQQKSIWAATKSDLLLPASAPRQMSRMLGKVGVTLTASDIRSRVCEDVGTLKDLSLRRSMQLCAAHQTDTTTTVARHYELKNKPERESQLLEFVESRYLSPAEIAVKDMVGSLGLDIKHTTKRKRLIQVNVLAPVSAAQEPTKKKARVVSALEPSKEQKKARVCTNTALEPTKKKANVSTKQICRNKKNSKVIECSYVCVCSRCACHVGNVWLHVYIYLGYVCMYSRF